MPPRVVIPNPDDLAGPGSLAIPGAGFWRPIAAVSAGLARYNGEMLAETVNIAQTIVFGVAFDPKNNDRVRNMDLNRLFASVGELFDLFAEREIEHVLVGGIAMLAYVEGRNTQDIDFIINAADLKKIPEIRIEEQNAEFARGWLGDLRMDFLFTKNKLFKLVLNKYSHRRKFADRMVPCATEDGLLLLKLFAIPSLYRQGLFPKVRIYEHDVAELISREKTD